MAEPVSNINDAGSPVSGAEDRFNTAGVKPGPPELPGTPPTDRLLPEGDRTNPRLNSAAERVGGAVGSAVGSMRRGMRVVGGRDRARSTRLADMADHKGRMADLADSASATVSDLTDTASEKLDELKGHASDLSQRAGERLGELKSTAGDRMSEFADTARDRLYYARRRANYLSNEYPVETILGFASLAFVIGFAIRIWRSNGD